MLSEPMFGTGTTVICTVVLIALSDEPWAVRSPDTGSTRDHVRQCAASPKMIIAVSFVFQPDITVR